MEGIWVLKQKEIQDRLKEFLVRLAFEEGIKFGVRSVEESELPLSKDCVDSMFRDFMRKWGE